MGQVCRLPAHRLIYAGFDGMVRRQGLHPGGQEQIQLPQRKLIQQPPQQLGDLRLPQLQTVHRQTPDVTTYTYSRNEGDFHAENIRIGNGEIFIDFVAPDTRINDIQLGVPVSINIENGVAAMALAHLSGATDEEIKQGMASFRGVDRRFDFKLKNDRIVFLSDYAHHPAEIAQSVKSVRELYQDKKITVIFQPHLYTRTRDFYRDFADSLSLSDEVILTEIYPAREQPIPGVTSQLIYDNLRPGIEKCICRKEDVLSLLAQKHTEVLVVLGAGDLDNYAPQITQLLSEKYHG